MCVCPYVTDRVSPHRRLRGGVVFVASIPIYIYNIYTVYILYIYIYIYIYNIYIYIYMYILELYRQQFGKLFYHRLHRIILPQNCHDLKIIVNIP